jgi:hypothetical protein
LRRTSLQETELLEKLDQDSSWVNDNYCDFQKYRGKVIAVKERKIVAVQDDVELLLKKLEKMKENPAFLLIEAIPPENVAFIL